MTAVPPSRLQEIYGQGDDPWAFRTSDYEQGKFRATVAALAKPRYDSALEVGCGNGELARHLAPRCGRFIGVDAVETALNAARRAVPSGRFFQGYLPCPLPEGPHELIVLSEILYFLDAAGLRSLAAQIAERWPGAEVLSVNWLGRSGNPLEGLEALGIFQDAMEPAFRPQMVLQTEQYRIDRFTAA
ncbi:MAG: class I SAM-dependent methyltransferase [Acetobacteraceae bacterium]|nr:MAG: class I SAM-dependent methyltransferase [Acetobacteraceae bacterium]